MAFWEISNMSSLVRGIDIAESLWSNELLGWHFFTKASLSKIAGQQMQNQKMSEQKEKQQKITESQNIIMMY